MNQNHPPPLHLQLHLALADIVDDVLEVLPSKGPPQGLPHQLLQKVKLDNLLDPLGDLSSTFTLLRMDAKFSSMLAGQQKCSHSPASTGRTSSFLAPQAPTSSSSSSADQLNPEALAKEKTEGLSGGVREPLLRQQDSCVVV